MECRLFLKNLCKKKKAVKYLLVDVKFLRMTLNGIVILAGTNGAK